MSAANDHEIPVSAEGQHHVLRGVHARRPALLVGAGIAMLVILGIILWLVLRGGGETTARRAPAKGMSIRELNELAGSIGHPVYWAGLQPRFTYEVSRTKDGRVYIRYLPAGATVGNTKAKYLTVGTYPQPNAFRTIRATAKTQGLRALDLAGGGVAFQYKSRPTSVYLAYPGSNYQIEVFDPAPAGALRLVTSGQIKPVAAPASIRAQSQAASAQQLRQLAVTLGHPIYWAGAQANVTYELTRTRDGSVYLRYLPPGVSVGERKPNYLTIGTYPQKRALALLKRTAIKNHVRTMNVGGGGVALVDKKHPTSVYVAYPHLDLQIEVYAPKPGRAQQLVASGQIAPIG
ncbi:MAG: hypothetical protein ACJ74X_07415 [Gaiellaceae bacterium]